MGLEGIAEGLHHLQSDYSKVADADLDAMFTQVRGARGSCSCRCGA